MGTACNLTFVKNTTLTQSGRIWTKNLFLLKQTFTIFDLQVKQITSFSASEHLKRELKGQFQQNVQMSDCVSINPGGHFSGNFQTKKKISWKQFALNTVYLVIFTPEKILGLYIQRHERARSCQFLTRLL